MKTAQDLDGFKPMFWEKRPNQKFQRITKKIGIQTKDVNLHGTELQRTDS